jgi:predicted ThiF/HesA family dinucleotide-utilizing enzyme
MSDIELKGELVIPEKLYVPLRSFGNRLIIADDERFREDDIVYTRANAKLIEKINMLNKSYEADMEKAELETEVSAALEGISACGLFIEAIEELD